jgi:ABC-type transport system involved in cytochrome c biogenesis ATPase subunit
MPRYIEDARQVFGKFKRCKEIVPFSALNGYGKSELLRAITGVLCD